VPERLAGETDLDAPEAPCSTLSQVLAEPLAGTAAAATTWLCIEQTGPYGADAVQESHLDHAVGAELVRRAARCGVRLQLIRRPGRHADDHHPGAPRQVFIAHTRPGATWMQHARFDDPGGLLDLDLDALAAGTRPGVGAPHDGPLLLVCTNGRRDVCCALYGRPVAAELVARHGETVWETTHTGGHRFAPTAVLLPSGYLYGRLDPAFADALLAAARSGRVITSRCRGRSTWSSAGQVAELAVRELSGETGPDALVVGPDDDDVASGNGAGEAGWRLRVTSVTGRSWSVRGRLETLEPERRTSCAKAPVVPTAHIVSGVSEIATASTLG
jgi:Sucrase/ferredoxin-like